MMYLTKNVYLDYIKNSQTQQKKNKKFKNLIIKQAKAIDRHLAEEDRQMLNLISH